MPEKNRTLLPFSIITKAASGNEEALNMVIEHYEKYILKLCIRECFDKNGMEYVYIDEDLRRRLERKLVIATMNFKVQ